jgi:hypothetical protein
VPDEVVVTPTVEYQELGDEGGVRVVRNRLVRLLETRAGQVPVYQRVPAAA